MLQQISQITLFKPSQVTLQVFRFLAALAVSEANRDAVVASGAIDAIASRMRLFGADPDVQMAACQLVTQLSRTGRHHEKMIEQGIPTMVTEVLTTLVSSAEVSAPSTP